jgi:hypothetical protein
MRHQDNAFFFFLVDKTDNSTKLQTTGVASSLLETIQGSGFKLQTLNLSFEDEEEFVA